MRIRKKLGAIKIPSVTIKPLGVTFFTFSPKRTQLWLGQLTARRFLCPQKIYCYYLFASVVQIHEKCIDNQ